MAAGDELLRENVVAGNELSMGDELQQETSWQGEKGSGSSSSSELGEQWQGRRVAAGGE